MKFSNILAGILLITSVIMMGFSGCKKYEEDDYWFTLRSVKNRLKGKQHLVEYTIDGKDSLQFFNNKYGDCYFEFSQESYTANTQKLTVYKAIDNQKIGIGNWSIKDNNQNKATHIGFLTKYQDKVFYSSPYFEIKKLTKDEFHMEVDVEDINYLFPASHSGVFHHIEIKFKKI